MHKFLIIDLIRPQKFRFGVGGHDLPRDQAIFSKALNGLEVSAFEIQIGFFNKLTTNILPGKCREEIEDRFVSFLSGRCGETGIQHLCWFRVTDCKFIRSLYVGAG